MPRKLVHYACGFAILKRKMTSHKDAKPANTVVTSNTGWGNWTRTRKLQLAGAVAVVVVLLAVGSTLMYLAVKGKSPTPTKPASHTTNPFSTQSQLNDAQSALTDAGTTEEKVQAYLKLGAAYMSSNQLPQAIDAYQKAETLSGDQDVNGLVQLSNLYNTTKQHQELLTTLQKLVALIQQQGAANPNTYRGGASLTWYQEALTRVQNGGWL